MLASLRHAAMSDLIVSNKEALSPDGVAVLDRVEAEAYSPTSERMPAPKTVHEKFSVGPDRTGLAD